MSSGLGIAFGVVVLLANAFFVGAELTVIPARRGGQQGSADHAVGDGDRLTDAGPRPARHHGLLAGLLAITEPALHHALEPPLHALDVPEPVITTIALVIAILVVGYLHILAGEMIPKNISLSVPDRAALLLAPPLVAISRVVRPMIVALNWAANSGLRLMRVPPKDEVSAAYTLEEVRTLVDASRREGLLGDQHDILTSSLTFGDRRARDVMVALDEVTIIPAGAVARDVEDLVSHTGHSRFPLQDRGTIVGYVHLQDTLDGDDTPHHQRKCPPARPPPREHPSTNCWPGCSATAAHFAAVHDDSGAAIGVVFFETSSKNSSARSKTYAEPGAITCCTSRLSCRHPPGPEEDQKCSIGFSRCATLSTACGSTRSMAEHHLFRGRHRPVRTGRWSRPRRARTDARSGYRIRPTRTSARIATSRCRSSPIVSHSVRFANPPGTPGTRGSASSPTSADSDQTRHPLRVAGRFGVPRGQRLTRRQWGAYS